MKKFRKILIRLLLFSFGLYAVALVFLYCFQEKLLFHPSVLAQEHKFNFLTDFEEVYIPVDKSVNLHGVLFKANQSKGLVFYLHGNGGCVEGWGYAAETFTSAGYDLFILDYRGYGKSGGEIESQGQIVTDVQKAYQFMLKKYDAANVVIAGYSIGTGPATILATTMPNKMLILQAPYYSLTSLIDEKVPLLPDFVKKYEFRTDTNIEKVSGPVVIFHGTDDKLIPFDHSQKLLTHCHQGMLIPLPGEGHNAINDSELFRQELKKMLQ